MISQSIMNILLPLCAVFIWSVNVIVSKVSVSAIDPAAISFYRWLLALLVLTPFILPSIIRNRRLVWQNFAKLLCLGLLGMALYQSLAYYAAHSVSALLMGIFLSLIPLFTMLISIWLLRIVPTAGIIAGSLLSLLGLIWLLSNGNPAQLLHQRIGKGEVMMFIAALSYALYGVLTRRWNIQLSDWHRLYVQIACGVMLLLPDFLLSGNLTITGQNLPLILFAGIPASILAPFLWIQGLLRVGVNTSAMLMNLSPVFTAIIAVLFLHEQLHSYHIIGGSITLLGVILAQHLRIPIIRRKTCKENMADNTVKTPD